MSTPKTTARLRRAEAQARFSDVVDDALHQTKTKQAHVARELGFSTPTKVQQWIDDDLAQLPTLADVACMPKALAHEILRRLGAEHGLIVSDAPASKGASLPHIRRIAVLAKESGEAQGAYGAYVLGNGTRRDAIREVRESLEANAAVLAALEDEAKSA